MPDLTIEVVVPVRPGRHDQFPVPTGGSVASREVPCADGNLSRVWRDAWRASRAAVVLFKHDDFWFRNWDSFALPLPGLLARYPIVGVAGTRFYTPQRPPWWQQNDRVKDRLDGLNRGMVAHPSPGATEAGGYLPTFFGPPGPAVVLDGCAIAVARDFAGGRYGPFDDDAVASWWDTDFGRHFYDVAFTLNATRAMLKAGRGPACYACVADVAHQSGGPLDATWQEAAARFAARYGGIIPVWV